MSSSLNGLLIVTLDDIEDIGRMKRRISEIAGVTSVEFSHLTHKLNVRYEGDGATIRRTELEIKKVVDTARKKEGTSAPQRRKGSRA